MKYEIAVIGASTAGLSAAAWLAEAGREVAVLDRNPRGRFSRRTYIVTGAIRRAIPELDPGLFLNSIHTMEVQAGEQHRQIRLAEPDLVIERRQLRAYLLRQAEKAGVQLHWERELLQVDPVQGTAVLAGPSGEESLLDSQVLIAADGVNSRVRSSLGLPAVPSVPLLQAEIQLPAGWDPGVTRVWFDVEKTPYFYWLIPESDRRAVVGLIAEPGCEIGSLLNEFLAERGYRAGEYQSGQAALHRPGLVNRTAVNGRDIYLVGDAAGQVKVTTVGGTVTGFLGAKSVLEQVQNREQNGAWGRQLTKELNLHALIRWLLERMDTRGYQALIQAITPPVAEFLGTHQRDVMRGQFWKLPFLQPRFLGLGLKLLLRDASRGSGRK